MSTTAKQEKGAVPTDGVGALRRPTRKDLSPKGVPRVLILFFTLGTLALSTQWVCNPSPLINLLLADGCLSWEYTPEEAKAVLLNAANVSYSVCLVSFAVMGMISSYIPLKWWCFGVIFNFGFCIWATMWSQSTLMVKAGILLGMHILPCVCIFAFSINEMFPNQLDLVNALVSSAGDISFCTTLMVKKVADSTGMSYKTTTLITFGIFMGFAGPCFFLTPRSWEPYSLSRKAFNNIIDLETWASYRSNMSVPSVRSIFDRKEKSAIEEKTNFVYDPYTMPYYFSFTQFYQVLLSKHMLIFCLWFLIHYVRDKKLLLPYMTDIIAEKAIQQGRSLEEANMMYDLYQFTPALGSVPGIAFGLLATRYGQLVSWQIANALCVLLFVILYIGPWWSMYIGSLLFSLHNALVFSLITAFVGKNYGFRHVQVCMGCAFCACGLLGFFVDATWGNVVNEIFHGSYLKSQIVNVGLSFFSMVPLAALYFLKFPGPPLAHEAGDNTHLESGMNSGFVEIALTEVTLADRQNSGDETMEANILQKA